MNESEFARPFDLRFLPAAPVQLVASEAECAALARRFDLVRIDRLSAEITLAPHGAEIAADGRLRAAIVQSCAISGDDLAVIIEEEIALRFVPARASAAAEIELRHSELDEIPYRGTAFDLGEAVAQSLALAIDPYATGPEADRARQRAGLSTPEASGPFAALQALRKK